MRRYCYCIKKDPNLIGCNIGDKFTYDVNNEEVIFYLLTKVNGYLLTSVHKDIFDEYFQTMDERRSDIIEELLN